jgi:hypothetical protein
MNLVVSHEWPLGDGGCVTHLGTGVVDHRFGQHQMMIPGKRWSITPVPKWSTSFDFECREAYNHL